MFRFDQQVYLVRATRYLAVPAEASDAGEPQPGATDPDGPDAVPVATDGETAQAEARASVAEAMAAAPVPICGAMCRSEAAAYRLASDLAQICEAELTLVGSRDRVWSRSGCGRDSVSVYRAGARLAWELLYDFVRGTEPPVGLIWHGWTAEEGALSDSVFLCCLPEDFQRVGPIAAPITGNQGRWVAMVAPGDLDSGTSAETIDPAGEAGPILGSETETEPEAA